MSSSSSSSSASRRIQEENENPPLTGMDLGFQKLEGRIIAERTTTCTTTQLQLRVPSIIDTIGCDITIEDIQLAKKELIKEKFDLKKDVNEFQKGITPLIHFCLVGNLLIIKLLFLIGADCTKLRKNSYWFPMLAAAESGHLDICKWLFECGGDAKYQINKVANTRYTPLGQSYMAWHHGHGIDKEGKTCRWLLLNGGGQHLSSKAMRQLRMSHEKDAWNSNLLVLWMRECIQLHDTFTLFLCGTTTMIATSTSSSSEPIDGTHRHKRKMHQERSLQILDGHPGIMESIGDYIDLIRGKEFRMLKEFKELVIEYENTHENSSDGSDDNAEDY